MRKPPLLTRTREITKPCLALYPSFLALSNRVGRSTRVTVCCFRHSIKRWRISASTKDFSGFAHSSAMYLYAIFFSPFCLFMVQPFRPHPNGHCRPPNRCNVVSSGKINLFHVVSKIFPSFGFPKQLEPINLANTFEASFNELFCLLLISITNSRALPIRSNQRLSLSCLC